MLGGLIQRLLRGVARQPGPDFSTVYGLYEQGRLDEAQRACDALCGVARADIDFLRGLIARKRGDFATAESAISAALDSRPEEATFHHEMAKVQLSLERYGKAIEAFERFLGCAPPEDSRRVFACVTAAACCIELGDHDGVRSWFERAREMDPSNAAILISGVLFDAGKVDEARLEMAAAPRAGAYLPRLRRALMIPAIYQSRDEIEATRERVSRELDELLTHERPERTNSPVYEIGLTPFYLAYHNSNNVEIMKAVCGAMRRAYAPPPSAVEGARRAGRIHIGFVSMYFYSHSVGRITLGLIRDLPRDRFSVSVFAVAPAEDPLRAAVERAADRYSRLPEDLDGVRRAIEAAQLDVLVYADIGMHPLTYFLALSRLAPLQIVAWGHPETTGIDTIDYFLAADDIETPQAQSHYSERLLRPKAFFLGGYPRPPTPQALDRAALGLPADRRLYGCLQPAFKLHPDFDAAFRQILERDPRAEILLLEARPAWQKDLQRRFARTLGSYEERVRFLPYMLHARFMATLGNMDVALDPFYFGGGNSSAEALSLGVPLVTLPGAHLYGRLTLGLYQELGLRECIAASVDDFAETALRLANERDYRENISSQIREHAQRLFDRKDATVAFAQCLTEELLA